MAHVYVVGTSLFWGECGVFDVLMRSSHGKPFEKADLLWFVLPENE